MNQTQKEGVRSSSFIQFEKKESDEPWHMFDFLYNTCRVPVDVVSSHSLKFETS